MSDPVRNPMVLLVDDERLVAELIAETLRDEGFEVLLAGSDVTAIEVLERACDVLFAVVTDIDLGPSWNGWDIGRFARYLAPHLAVVYMSGGNLDSWRGEAMPHSLMLRKPFAPRELLSVLAALGVRS